MRTGTTLPIRTRCVVGAEGLCSVRLTVFCPKRAATLSVDACERCPHLAGLDVRGGDRPSVACRLVTEATREEHVGALGRPVVICVRRRTPIDALENDERRSRMIPVVDEADRYVGALVQGHSSRPSASRNATHGFPGDTDTAEDALEHLPAVNERSDLVSAASTMTSSRARCVPLVNDAQVVVGVLDDVAMLGSIARVRHASAVMKRCACGEVFTREQWSDLPFIGAMTGARGEQMELRNCTSCGSTIAVPAAEASSHVA